MRSFARVCVAGALVLVGAAWVTHDEALRSTALAGGVVALAVSAVFAVRAARPGQHGGLAEGLLQLALLMAALAALPR